MKTILGLALATQAFAATPAVIPEGWYQLPENQPAQHGFAQAPVTEIPENKKKDLASLLDRIIAADAESFDKASYVEEALTSDPSKPKDWVPWHPEMIVTELGLSTSGLVGLVTMKGTAGAAVYWRRQGAEQPKKPVMETAGDPTTIPVGDDTTPAELARELEPAIRAAVATGRIKDEGTLRKNLITAAEEFRGVVQGLQDDHGNSWWVSKVRLDVTADASGKIIGFIAVGGEVRFRFEWARIEKQNPVAAHLSPRMTEVKSSLAKFVRMMSSDLMTVADNLDKRTGFEVHSFRVGVGATAKGDIGIVKGGASLIGQVYFARNAKKPVVKPAPNAFVAEDFEPLLLIEDAPVRQHLAFAEENGIEHELDAGAPFDRALYKLDRARFRKGLDKAMGIAGFFADRASKSPARKWKIFELKSSFDLSIAGDLGFAALGGLATVEFNLYNQNF